MKKWRCTVCGQIVESDVRPDKCPLCKAPKSAFGPKAAPAPAEPAD